MSGWIAFAVGIAAGAVTGWALLPLAWRRAGATSPLPSGAAVVLGVVLGHAAYAVAVTAGASQAAVGAFSRATAVTTALGFGLLGLLADLADEPPPGRGRRITAGNGVLPGLLVLGFVLALAVVAPFAPNVSRLLVQALVVVLAAAAGRLTDGRPGRAVKVAVLGLGALAVVGALTSGPSSAPLTGPALVVGSGAASLAGAWRGRVPLGDTGALVLGAALGLGVVVLGIPSLELVALVVLVGVHLAAERLSLTKVLAEIAPLRWLDGLGVRRADPPGGE